VRMGIWNFGRTGRLRRERRANKTDLDGRPVKQRRRWITGWEGPIIVLTERGGY
jgi:hypothetical protein